MASPERWKTRRWKSMSSSLYILSPVQSLMVSSRLTRQLSAAAIKRQHSTQSALGLLGSLPLEMLNTASGSVCSAARLTRGLVAMDIDEQYWLLHLRCCLPLEAEWGLI